MTKCKTALKDCALFLLLAILAAAPAIADYIPPGGEGSGRLVLGGTPATLYTIIAPDYISDWSLSPVGDGMNEVVGTLQVGANGNWQVTAKDLDTTTTNGFMTEHDGTGYVTTDPEQLDSPMSISVESGGNVDTGYEVTLPTGGMIAKGGTTGGENEMKDVEVTFKQPVSWNDKPLEDGHSYRIVVTFTISEYS
ncbi:MAG TPA: hypothetical protein PLQ49_06320 [Methanothrix sp.]|nr:hypothetical protein [Methanothrix sp.]HRW83319.1 hypothetical protein [Methanothrix sp.]